MKFYLMMLAIGGGLFMSCERHEFEGENGTKKLNMPHGAHGGKAAHGEAAHGDAADKEPEAKH